MAMTAACATQSLALKSSFVGQRTSLQNRSEVRGARVVALASRNTAVRQTEKEGFFDWLTNVALTKGEALNEKDPLLMKTNKEAGPVPKGRAPAKVSLVSACCCWVL
jgi:hypothetical protein